MPKRNRTNKVPASDLTADLAAWCEQLKQSILQHPELADKARKSGLFNQSGRTGRPIARVFKMLCELGLLIDDDVGVIGIDVIALAKLGARFPNLSLAEVNQAIAVAVDQLVACHVELPSKLDS